MDKKTVQAFFKNQCTREEAEKVLDWLDTPEGKSFLNDQMDKDQQSLSLADLEEAKIDSDTLFQRIEGQISKKEKKYKYRSKVTRFSAFKRVAAVLLLVTVSAFAMYNFGLNEEKEVARVVSKTFKTGEDELRELTLNDGTQIRLNSNSNIEVITGKSSKREVKLNGEAFFQVSKDEDRPFIIHANKTRVRVLGTSFNVKSDSTKNDVQVAVQEGQVSVEYSEDAFEDSSAKVEVTKGEFAYVDLERAEISVDQAAVSNYWSWIDRRFSFDQASLEEVSLQLSRIYDVHFQFRNLNLKTKKLSTDFERESLEKTLSVISLTLDLEYSRDADTITWSNK